MQLLFSLLNSQCENFEAYLMIFNTFSTFINECLKAFINVIKSEQKKYLKTMDTDLVIQVLKMANSLILKSDFQDRN